MFCDYFFLEKFELRADDDFCPKQMNKREKRALTNTLNFIKDHEYVLSAIVNSSYLEEMNPSVAESKSDWETLLYDSHRSYVSDDHVDPYAVAHPFERGDKMRTIPVATIGWLRVLQQTTEILISIP